MPHTDMVPRYEISLTDVEFRVVTLALAGLLEDKQDIAASRQLNEQLCRQRGLLLKQAIDVASKAHEHAKKIMERDVPAPQPKETT